MWPSRIITLTSETTELVFALGAGDRLVGVSGYSVRPPEAREKEKVAAFTSVKMDKIRALKPDLILGFSDLQKQIAHDLIAEGFNVFISNQRTLEEIGNTFLAIGRLIGCETKANELYRNFFKELDELSFRHCSPKGWRNPSGRISPRADEESRRDDVAISDLSAGKAGIASLAARNDSALRPKVYFEEWDEPMISGISWVSELIEKLGGQDVFREKSFGKVAKERYVTSEEVIAANPDLILASWCGKKVQPEKIRTRPGWDQISAVRENRIYEIKSSDILAPGLSILHGARQIAEILQREECGRTGRNKEE